MFTFQNRLQVLKVLGPPTPAASENVADRPVDRVRSASKTPFFGQAQVLEEKLGPRMLQPLVEEPDGAGECG